MNGKYGIIGIMVILVLLAFLNAQEKSNFTIITNVENKTESVSSNQLSKIFLKKITRWDNGSKIYPLDQLTDSPVRKDFSNDVHGKRVSSIKAFWQKQIFSGSSVPPVEKKTDREVIEYVKQNPGAIGYVSAGTKVKGVKVLKVRS